MTKPKAASTGEPRHEAQAEPKPAEDPIEDIAGLMDRRWRPETLPT